MIIIGITGGIGAGKSSVAMILQDMGALVIDADQVSKEVVQPHMPAWIEIKERFGESIFKEDETLNRSMLAKIVFSSEEKRLELEKIIHKQVVAQIENKLRVMKGLGYNGVVALDVPIPIKRGFMDVVDKVWVVVCDDKVRIKRVMERGGISMEDAENRINSQLTQEEYMELADEIIENNGNIMTLTEKVHALYTKLLNSENN